MIEKKGKLIRKEKEGKDLALTFESSLWKKPLKRGESISINGVCLTVTRMPKRNRFTVQAVPETLGSTTLDSIRLREAVNLERSIKWGDRIGGHFVLGHVDGVGKILRRHGRGKSFSLEIEVPPVLLQNLVPKGSISIDGVSLTLQKISRSSITAAIIPFTAKTTTLGRKVRGDRVNLEADVIAKHLAQLVQPQTAGALL